MIRDRIKCVVVGDVDSGKSSLIATYTEGIFPSEPLPSVLSTVQKDVLLESGSSVGLSLWDTPGDRNLDRTRPLSYSKGDVILLCFPVNKIRSLNDIRSRWQEEIDEYAPDAALILVGTKADMRDGNIECIKDQDIQVLLSELDGEGYFEVSARNVQGVYELFKFTAEIGLKKKKNQQKCCCLIS